MEKIIYNLVFNRRKHLNKKGLALVQVEAYQNRKKKYFSTKVYLRPEQWDAKRRKIRNHPNSDALNRLIYSYVADIEKKELELWQQQKVVTLEALKEYLTAEKGEEGSFLAFFRREITHSALKESTKRNHLSTLARLREYRKEVSFAELTFEFISSFDHYLQAKGYHVNTIAKHMKHLKRYINIAINKEYIDVRKYAFRKYRIKSVENSHTHLSPEELNRIEGLVLEGRHARLEKTRNAFLFCCYAGLRYSDFVHLTPDNFICIQNEMWLIYQTVKTRTEVRLPIYLLFEGKGLEILHRYQNRLSDFFDLKSNSNVNKELTILSRLAGIGKKVSFHTARHTNATLLIYDGVNITTVQKLLGHKSVKTTQVYTNVMDMTIVRDLEKSRFP